MQVGPMFSHLGRSASHGKGSFWSCCTDDRLTNRKYLVVAALSITGVVLCWLAQAMVALPTISKCSDPAVVPKSEADLCT